VCEGGALTAAAAGSSRGGAISIAANCGLVYERNPGDTWAFTVIGDRLPVAAGIILVYFGLFRVNRTLGVAAFVVLTLLLVWSAPNRWGVGIALHYLSRVYFPDPQDPVPPLEDRERR
jgi:hypothetical protein